MLYTRNYLRKMSLALHGETFFNVVMMEDSFVCSHRTRMFDVAFVVLLPLAMSSPQSLDCKKQILPLPKRDLIRE